MSTTISQDKIWTSELNRTDDYPVPFRPQQARAFL